jgi:hypothetical protein
MITQDQKDSINKIILRCLGYTDSTLYMAPDELKDIEKHLKLEDSDYEAILKKKQDVDLQLRTDHDLLCTLVALRRYSSDIEQGSAETNSDIMMDNFEEELEYYVRNYL